MKHLGNNRQQATQGFTLIELMIVVAIIAVLAGIAIPQYNEYIRKSQVTEATATLLDYRTRLEQYFQDNRRFEDINLAAGSGVCGIPPTVFTNLRYFTIACVAQITNDDGTAGANDALRYRISATGNAQGLSNGVVYRVDEQNRRWTTGFVRGNATVGNTPDAGCWLTSGAECPAS